MPASRLPLILPFLLPVPALADDVEASLEAALAAYRAGDAAAAMEEAEFAAALLGQIKAQHLGAFLPAPLEGWTREEDPQAASPAGGMFAGGMSAQARYTRGGEEVVVALSADSPMVQAMVAMFGNAAALGAMGQVIRVGGERAVVTPDGELQALVDGRILVSVSGPGSAEEKRGWLEAMDLDALAEF